MRLLTVFTIFFLAICILNSVALADSIQNRNSSSIYTTTFDNKYFTSKASYTKGDLLTLYTTYREDLPNNLIAQEEKQGLWELKINSSLINGLLQTEGVLALSTYNPFTNKDISDDSYRFSKFVVKGSLKEFLYGVSYQFVGKEFNGLKITKMTLNTDREGTDLWIVWSFGNLSIKPTFKRYHDNLAEDPNRPRFTDTQAGSSLSYTLSSLPYLKTSAFYFRGVRDSSLEPEDYEPFEGPIENIGHSISYSSSKLNVSFYSSYSSCKDTLQASSRETNTVYHSISSSFYLTNSLSLTPGLSYINDKYLHYNAQTLTRSASLGFNYRLSESVKFNAYGSYSDKENQQWYLDTEYIYAKIGVVHTLSALPQLVKNFSLNVSYDYNLDNIYSDNNRQEISFWLIFKSMSL